jgi:hypothetical protein
MNYNGFKFAPKIIEILRLKMHAFIYQKQKFEFHVQLN